MTKDCELQKLRYILNDNIWTVAYAIFMSVWACLFLEFWKRQQFHYAVEWDVTDIEEINEPMRASYRATAATSQGDYRTNPVTLKRERYSALGKKKMSVESENPVLATHLISGFKHFEA